MADNPRQETENTSMNEVKSYRTGIADLLAIQVNDANTIEHKLGVVVGDEASARAAFEDIPFGPFRLHCALLLHKAIIHAKAVCHANDSNSLHSLAVQMRPILECAGQIKHVTHNLLIEPEHARGVMDFLDRDYLGTFVRATKGQKSHKHLLDEITDIRSEFGEDPPGKLRKIKQVEKVVVLEGGKNWCDHLSEGFCHGDGDWQGLSWQGGVVSTNTVVDEFTFAGHMDYLVEQVAIMNSYAALQIPSTKTLGERTEIVLKQLQKVRSTAMTLRDAAVDRLKEHS